MSAVVGLSNDASGYYDPEKNATGDHYCFSETTPTYVRHDFIKKVFGIVAMQLLATFSFVATCYNVTAIRTFLSANLVLLYVAIALFVASMLVVACFPSLMAKKRNAIILTSIVTVCMAINVSYVTLTYAAFEITIAAGITAVLVVGLVLFAFQTKYDFTSWIWYMFPVMLGLMIAGILLIFFPSKIASIIYAALGAILISIYLVIDIQLTVGGKKHEWTIDDYIVAALMIYLDIINLFLYILRLVKVLE